MLGAKLWYLMEGGSLGIPAIVVDENGPIVRLANDPTKPARSVCPSLDLSHPEDQATIEFCNDPYRIFNRENQVRA